MSNTEKMYVKEAIDMLSNLRKFMSVANAISMLEKAMEDTETSYVGKENVLPPHMRKSY